MVLLLEFLESFRRCVDAAGDSVEASNYEYGFEILVNPYTLRGVVPPEDMDDTVFLIELELVTEACRRLWITTQLGVDELPSMLAQLDKIIGYHYEALSFLPEAVSTFIIRDFCGYEYYRWLHKICICMPITAMCFMTVHRDELCDPNIDANNYHVTITEYATEVGALHEGSKTPCGKTVMHTRGRAQETLASHEYKHMSIISHQLRRKCISPVPDAAAHIYIDNTKQVTRVVEQAMAGAVLTGDQSDDVVKLTMLFVGEQKLQLALPYEVWESVGDRPELLIEG